MTVFDKNGTEALRKSAIQSLVAANDGTLWMIVDGELVQLKAGQFINLSSKYQLNDVVTSIYAANDGSLWAGTNDGVLVFKNEGMSRQLQGETIVSIAGVGDLNVWIVARKGRVFRFRDPAFEQFTAKHWLPNKEINFAYASPDGGMWLGFAGRGLEKWKGGQHSSFAKADGLPGNDVSMMVEDRDGNLWVATEAGFSRCHERRCETFAQENPLSGDTVVSMLEDSEGSLWLGTTHRGLQRLRDTKFISYGPEEGVGFSLTSAILQDRRGGYWIGGQKGLNRLENGKITNYSVKDGLAEEFISALYESRDGSIWIGHRNSLSRFKSGRFRSYHFDGEIAARDPLYILSILEGRNGTFWLGTKHGLWRFKDEKVTQCQTADGAFDATIYHVYEDRKGEIWLGTASHGLGLLTDQERGTFETDLGPPKVHVMIIHEDVDGSLWLGTSTDGLFHFNAGRFTQYGIAQGLYDSTIYNLVEDNQRNLWLAGNKGIFRVSINQLHELDQGLRPKVDYVLFSADDGMKTRECSGGSQPSALKDRDGNLWFPTREGPVVIDPAHYHTNNVAPPVLVEGMSKDGQQVDMSVTPQLTPGSQRFDISYTALSFLRPSRVRFKYKLEGFDRNWIDAGTQRVAHYTNLPSGRYRFVVIASNDDGVWNETGTSFVFYLRPHFYQIYWFYALCLVGTLFSAFALYRLRVRQLRRRTQVLEKIVDERTGELKRSQAQIVELEKQAAEQRMAGGFAHEMRNALAGSKLILDQALALGGKETSVSLNLANCQKLKGIYLNVKDCVDEDRMRNVLADMQTIFANEERLNEILELVYRATSRGLNITQQIMEYSKIGQQSRGRENIDLNNIINDIMRESLPEFLKQGVQIRFEPSQQGCAVVGDETHFYSVFKNIILNARDALVDPAVKDHGHRIIQIVTKVQETRAVVSIRDNGVGIPEENLKKIFEPFFSTKPASGTGLGLGMVKNILAVYDGTIDVSSTLGKGTCFTIGLPLSTAMDVKAAA